MKKIDEEGGRQQQPRCHASGGTDRGVTDIPALVEARRKTTDVTSARVLRRLAAGSTNGEITRTPWVTERMYRKLGVTNRTEARHYADGRGWWAACGELAVSGGSKGNELVEVCGPTAP